MARKGYVVRVDEGELVIIESGGERSKVTVAPKCDRNLGCWYCATHREFFQNQMQKDIHIHANKHRMAWFCFEHGVEVP